MGYVTQVTIKASGHLENYFHSIVLNFFEFILVNAYSSKQRMNYSFNCPIYLLIKMQKLLMKIVILNILQPVFLWGIKRVAKKVIKDTCSYHFKLQKQPHGNFLGLKKSKKKTTKQFP